MLVSCMYRLAGVTTVLWIAAACGRDEARDPDFAMPADEPGAMMPADEAPAELTNAADNYIAAWNGNDAEAVARHFTDDARAQVDDSTYTGLAEIRERWLQPNVPAVSGLESQEERLTARGEEYHGEGRYSATISPPDAESFRQTGRYTATWVRAPDGSWRIRETTITSDETPM
jgi:ketosteroid isomerase-like protein